MTNRIDSYLTFAAAHPHLFDNTAGQLEIVLDRETLISEQQKLYEKADRNGKPRHYYDIGIVAEDDYVVVIRDLVRFGENRYGGYIRTLNRSSTVARAGKDVVVLAEYEGKFILLRHFRHEIRSYMEECPRGFGEAGLTAEENARKELAEETGLSVSLLRRLNHESEPIAYFFAECKAEGTETVFRGDAGEGIDRISLVTREQLEKMIANGSVRDMYTIRAYLLWKIVCGVEEKIV